MFQQSAGLVINSFLKRVSNTFRRQSEFQHNPVMDVEETPTLEEVQRTMPQLSVSNNALNQIIELYNQGGSAVAFQEEIVRHYSIEEITSSLNGISKMILTDDPFIPLNTRIDKLKDWIRFMQHLQIFRQDVYHLSLAYALECLHRAMIAEDLAGKNPEIEHEYQLRFGFTPMNDLQKIEDYLAMIGDLQDLCGALLMGITLRGEYKSTYLGWPLQKELVDLAWAAQQTVRPLNPNLLRYIVDELSFQQEFGLKTLALFKYGKDMLNIFPENEIEICKLLAQFMKELLMQIYIDTGMGFIQICQMMNNINREQLCKQFVEMAVAYEQNRLKVEVPVRRNIVDVLLQFESEEFFDIMLNQMQRYPKLHFIMLCKTKRTTGAGIDLQSHQGRLEGPEHWFLFLQQLSHQCV